MAWVRICVGAGIQGFFEAADCNGIQGCAWDNTQPLAAVEVDIYDGATLIQTAIANVPHAGLNNYNGGIGGDNHGWIVATPAVLKDGYAHTVHIKRSGTQIDLPNPQKR